MYTKGGDNVGIKINVNIDKNKLKQHLLEETKSKISADNFDIDCPHCGKKVSAPAGKSICPFCNNEINLKLDFKF